MVLVFVFEEGVRAELGLFYEKRVTSLGDLLKAVRALDEDSGVRLVGERQGRKCLVFLTRFGRRYTLMTYAVKARTGAPGKRLEAVEVDGVEATTEAIRKVAQRRIEAYVY